MSPTSYPFFFPEIFIAINFKSNDKINQSFPTGLWILFHYYCWVWAMNWFYVTLFLGDLNKYFIWDKKPMTNQRQSTTKLQLGEWVDFIQGYLQKYGWGESSCHPILGDMKAEDLQCMTQILGSLTDFSLFWGSTLGFDPLPGSLAGLHHSQRAQLISAPSS